MATPAPAGSVWQVLVQGIIEDQQCENVLYFRTPLGDSDVLLHLIADLVECFVTGLVPVLSQTYTFERIVARQIAPALGDEVIYTPPSNMAVQGASAGDSEPSFVSALISLRTTRAGRSGRGRMFVAGVPEGQTIGSRINTEAELWAGLLAFCVCMLGKFLTQDPPVADAWEWGVFSRKLGNAKAPFLLAGFAPMRAAQPVNYLSTTRSRKVGRGR